MKKEKKEPWRVIVFIISVLFIIFMFIKKDTASVYGTISAEEALPVLVTNIAVTLLKVTAIAGIAFIGKHIIGKLKNKREE